MALFPVTPNIMRRMSVCDSCPACYKMCHTIQLLMTMMMMMMMIQTVELLLLIQYSGASGLAAGYCRQCSLSLTIDILPVIYVTDWSATVTSRFALCHCIVWVLSQKQTVIAFSYSAEVC